MSSNYLTRKRSRNARVQGQSVLPIFLQPQNVGVTLKKHRDRYSFGALYKQAGNKVDKRKDGRITSWSELT